MTRIISMMKSCQVTILAPMKRGLKAKPRKRSTTSTACYNPCPDEKGTESYDELLRPLISAELQSLPR